MFRYALERWPPDPYYLAVFHAAEGGEAVAAVLANLEERAVNLQAESVNLDEVEADDWRLSGVDLDRDKLPWAVLRYPPRGGQAPPIAWSGKLDAAMLASLTSSRVRQEVARRLLTGESAVWVLVNSGDGEKDRAALETLERNLAEAKSKLRIPGVDELDYSPADGSAPAPAPMPLEDSGSSIPMKIDFSVVSLSRDNSEEQSFLAMLLHSEPDLQEYADDPIVFPMFGQGRALWALVGKGINAENILESCIFLTGPCSCQVKHMNPGTDILMEFDWSGALEGRVPPPPEFSPDMLTSVAPVLDDGEESQPDQLALAAGFQEAAGSDSVGRPDNSRGLASASRLRPGAPEGTAASDTASRGTGAPVFAMTGAVLGGLLLIVAAATVILLRKKKD